MQILSIKQGLEADHSSSSYQFFAIKPLVAQQRQAVQQLTGESARRRLKFHYQGEWRDIPSDWPDKLLALGYDILVSESYDWWSVCLSLPNDPNLEARLAPYKCGAENGFEADVKGERLLLTFNMHLDYGAVFDEFGEDPFKGLARLFTTVRDEILAGNLSAVWAMYETYCVYEEADEDAPRPVEPLSEAGQTLLNIMENY